MNFLKTYATRWRALAVVTALAAGSLATGANAQGTVSLSTGASCQYSSISVAPNGNMTVACGTTTVVAPTCSNGVASASVGGSASLTAVCQNSPTTYSWATPAGAPAPANANAGFTAVGPFPNPGTYTYTVTAANSAGSTTADVVVTVAAPNAVPSCTIAPTSPISASVGSPVTLTATCTEGPTSYIWAGDVSNPAGAPAPAQAASTGGLSFATPGTYIYGVIATNSIGSSVPVAATINVTAASSCPTLPTGTAVPPVVTDLSNLRFNLKQGQVGYQKFDLPWADKTLIRVSGIGGTASESPAGLTAQIAISPCPGQFTVPAGCSKTITKTGGNFYMGTLGCIIGNGSYYVNIRNVDSSGNNTCNPAPGFNYCTMYVKFN